MGSTKRPNRPREKWRCSAAHGLRSLRRCRPSRKCDLHILRRPLPATVMSQPFLSTKWSVYGKTVAAELNGSRTDRSSTRRARYCATLCARKTRQGRHRDRQDASLSRRDDGRPRQARDARHLHSREIRRRGTRPCCVCAGGRGARGRMRFDGGYCVRAFVARVVADSRARQRSPEATTSCRRWRPANGSDASR